MLIRPTFSQAGVSQQQCQWIECGDAGEADQQIGRPVAIDVTFDPAGAEPQLAGSIGEPSLPIQVKA